MSPNETFAIAACTIAGRLMGTPLTTGDRPDFRAIDVAETRASNGEWSLVTSAQDAWAGRGFFRALAAVDAGVRAEVLRALVDAYEVAS